MLADDQTRQSFIIYDDYKQRSAELHQTSHPWFDILRGTKSDMDFTSATGITSCIKRLPDAPQLFKVMQSK